MSTDDPAEFSKKLGTVFREERERQGFSRKKLSEVADVGRTGIILFERGERVPTIFVCKAIANALRVPLSRLVRRAEKLMEQQN